MATFTLTVECNNEAFDPDWATEVASILRAAGDKLESTRREDGKLYDANGNSVGSWLYDPTDD